MTNEKTGEESDLFFNGQLTMDNYSPFTINYQLIGDRPLTNEKTGEESDRIF